MNLFEKIAPEVPSLAMEEGIVKLVGILNSKGLPTKLSCEGHSSRGSSAWIEIEGAHFKVGEAGGIRVSAFAGAAPVPAENMPARGMGKLPV